jgi:hypothetical protein
MKHSPFPGMDPYLERYWDDVHLSLCGEIRTDPNPALPKGLRARAGQNIWMDEVDEHGRRDRTHPVEGDTVVVATGPATAVATRRASLSTVEPVVVPVIQPVHQERWVQIIDVSDGNRVVTVIEVLSPGNQRAGNLNRRYRRKLTRYVNGGVNVVEIDLLRSSRARLVVTDDDIPPSRRAAYYACVSRLDRPHDWLAYPMALREPLPVLSIPLRPGRDDDVPLALQPIIDRIYVEGGYEDIDYSVPVRPRLAPEDEAWAAERIANRPA